MTEPIRRVRKQRPLPPRRALPDPQPLRLPNGYYDPDSASFDAPPTTDMSELLRTTMPMDAALRPVRS